MTLPHITFAEFFHTKRRATGLPLRKFCLRHGFDAGNMSKLERGILPAPQTREKLETYATALGIREGTDDWLEFFDLAAASAHRLPDDIASDEEVIQYMPVLFRAVRDAKGRRDLAAERKMLIDLGEAIRKELRP